MTDKPLKCLNGKKFEGVLAAPIDTGLFMPVRLDDPAWPLYLQAKESVMIDQRLAKMPVLARHMDIDVEQFTDASTLYTAIALKLASHVVPGFQEKSRGKQPREIIRLIRKAVDASKGAGIYDSDFAACCAFLKVETPDLARPGKKSELEQKARSLQNLIAKDRASVERAEKAVHKKPRLRVVK